MVERETSAASRREWRPRRLRWSRAALLSWVVLLGALGLAAWFAPEEAAVRSALARLGPAAPLGYLAAEFVQVLIIPVPGQPFEVAGGWLFGLGLGVLLGSAGAVVGSLAAFDLGRRYGRPWVEARVKPEVRQRFERWGGGAAADGGGRRRADWLVFWLMLLPAFPRDPLCYLAGVTDISRGRFRWIVALGRPVGLVPWVALGANGVGLGLKLQLALAGVPGLLWLAHTLWKRGRRALRAASAGKLAGESQA